MKEAISNRNEDVVEKEKVMFPEIVVRGTDDKPYYEIQYYDVTDKQWHLGYGSYNLEYVKQWKKECLEIVEGSVTNILCEKIKERLEELRKAELDRVDNIDENGRYNDCEEAFEDGESQGRFRAYSKMINFVNQVAEEFATDTNVGHKDGWIPVSSGKLPEEKENPVTRDWYVYPVMVKFEEITDIRYYSFGNGHWHHGPGIMDKYVTHWMDIKPYQPKGE